MHTVHRTLTLLLLLLPMTLHSAALADKVVDLSTDLREDEDAPRLDLQAVHAAIIRKTNAFRQEQGLGEVKIAAPLDATSASFAQWMADNMKYGHTADGRQPGERATAAKYEYCIVSENIAYIFDSRGVESEEVLAERLVQGWINSPPHRENMVNPHVVEIGVGVARSAGGIYLGVQMFGRPKSLATTFRIENTSGMTATYELNGTAYPIDPRVTRTHTLCVPGEIKFPGIKKAPRDPESYPTSDKAHFKLLNAQGGGVRLSAVGVRRAIE